MIGQVFADEKWLEEIKEVENNNINDTPSSRRKF